MDTLHFEARGRFRVAPEALWPLLSDTARMNRAIGSPPVSHTIVPDEDGGSRIEGEVRLFGLPLARYHEHPFHWEAPHGFSVVRELPSGPLARIRAAARLVPTEDGGKSGTEVVVSGDFVPRTALGGLLARFVGPRSVQGTLRQCHDFERYLLGEADSPYPRLMRVSRLAGVRGLARRLGGRAVPTAPDPATDDLVARGLSREAVEVLRCHLAEAPDEDVTRMGPFELADRWGLDRQETLGLFLHATAVGLLVMHWDVLCPNCRVSKARAESLRELVGQAHCSTCNITFDAAFDRSVQVRFSVAPILRAVSTDEYCIGGPMNTPHVLAQTAVPAGQTERLRCVLEAGSYRLRPRGGHGRLMLTASLDVPAGSAPEPSLTVTVGADGIEPAVADVPPGPLALDLVNATDHEQVVVLEGSLWPDTVVTAATVCATPEFRELFPQETLAPGVRLGIEYLTFVVVDAGPPTTLPWGPFIPTAPQPPSSLPWGPSASHLPTAPQAGEGEPARDWPAGLPLSTAVGRGLGGGGAPLTFTSPADALVASLRIVRESPESHVGVSSGACVVANVDGRLEFLGRSVEIAQGLARAARAGEIVASLDVCHSSGAAGLLQRWDIRQDEALLQLPEADAPVPACLIAAGEIGCELPAPVEDTPDSLPLGPGAHGDGAPLLREWLARRHGPLRFDYRHGSYAGERIDAIVAAYAAALARILAFLGRPESSVPPLWIRLDMTAEQPGPLPELVLTPLVLDALLGPAHPLGQFWEDGLAGYLAAEAGSSEHAEAPRRILALHEEGQLAPLADRVQQRAERASSASALAATAFASYLIAWRGPERFCRLLRASRSGHADAFRRVYRQPIPSVEGRWLHDLESAEQGSRRAVLGSLRDLLPYFRAYRLHLGAIFGLILLGLLFDLFTPLALSFLIDNVLHRTPLGVSVPTVGQAGERIAPDQQLPTLLKLLGLMSVMLAVNAISRLQQTRLLAELGEGVTLDLRRRFFEHLQRLPVSFHARTSATDLSQRFFTDIGQVPTALSTGLSLVINGVAMVTFGSTLLSLNLWLGLVAIAGLPFFALAARRGRAAMRQAGRERGRRASEMQQALFENLAGQRFLRAWNACAGVRERFEQRLAVHRDLNIRMAMLGQTLARASTLITNVAQLAVLGLGSLLVIATSGESLSPGGLMAAYLLLMRLYMPAGSFAGAIQSLEQAADALTRLHKIMDLPTEAEPPDAVPLAPLSRALELNDLSVLQPNGKARLRGITAEIPAGAKVAFVGGTGSGAASLMTLLPRLESPTAGRIFWDGLDVQAATRASLRDQLTVVQQDTFVLRASIYDNIWLGRPAATEAEVLAAARTAGLHEIVTGWPGGYDTVVGDRDPLLTTATRQRLGVAQALLRGGSAILMDDATAALDVSAQRELEAALRGLSGIHPSDPGSCGPGLVNLSAARTLIRVTHRASTVADADRIYVLDDGRIVEQGTHEELLARDGLYAQLLADEVGDASLSGARQAVRRLRSLAPFAQLSPDVQDQLAKLVLFMVREPGQEIVRQGGRGDELFVIGRGEIEVVAADEDGHERLVNVLGEGDLAGEISFLHGIPRTATLRARTPVELYVLRRSDFDQLLARCDASVLAHHADVMSQIETMAQVRLDATAARLAAVRT